MQQAAVPAFVVEVLTVAPVFAAAQTATTEMQATVVTETAQAVA